MGAQGEAWMPGDYTTARIAERGSPQFFSLQEGEIWNSRIAMLAVLAYVVQEVASGIPTAWPVDVNPPCPLWTALFDAHTRRVAPCRARDARAFDSLGISPALVLFVGACVPICVCAVHPHLL